MNRFIPLIILLQFISACGAGPSEPPEATATMPANDSAMEWSIKMTHSGGIMGLLRHIEVNSNGEFIVSDELSKQIKTGLLPQNDMTVLDDLVVAANPINIDPLKNMVCADCFVYALEIRKDGESFSAELSDISLPDSGYEPLVAKLREIIDKELR